MTHSPETEIEIRDQSEVADYVLSVLDSIGRAVNQESGVVDYEAIEKALLSNTSKELVPNIQISHQFCSGVYMREMQAQAGALVLGHAHNESCFNIILKGRMRVLVDGKLMDVQGPCIFKSEAGSRKLGYVLEDLTWINVIASETTDVEDIEKRFINKSPTYLEWEASNQLT